LFITTVNGAMTKTTKQQNGDNMFAVYRRNVNCIIVLY